MKTRLASTLAVPQLAVTRNFRSIAVLTSGGDAPGMNAAIRAVVRAPGRQHSFSLLNGGQIIDADLVRDDPEEVDIALLERRSVLDGVCDVDDNGELALAARNRRAQRRKQLAGVLGQHRGAEMEHREIGIVDKVDAAVRAQVAERLAPVETAPNEILRRLGGDDEIRVAGPVLSQSKCLD